MIEPQYEFADISKEEAQIVQDKIDAVLAEHEAQFIPLPIIMPNGTLGANLHLFKKVAKPIPFPPEFTESNGTDTPTVG